LVFVDGISVAFRQKAAAYSLYILFLFIYLLLILFYAGKTGSEKDDLG